MAGGPSTSVARLRRLPRFVVPTPLSLPFFVAYGVTKSTVPDVGNARGAPATDTAGISPDV